MEFNLDPTLATGSFTTKCPQELRSFLTDVPLSKDFGDSVRLLEDAFRRRDWRMGLAPEVDCDDVLFLGRRALVSLFGEDFPSVVERIERELNVDSCLDSEYLEDCYRTPLPACDLRNQVDSYVVVGVSNAEADSYKSRWRLKKVIFKSGMIDRLASAQRPVEGSEWACESVRARSGLMNMRQAKLLAHHLNTFRRNQNRYESLTWTAVKGPEADASARQWLDSIGGNRLFLRRLVGELKDRGLERSALSGLAVFACERASSSHAEQIFAYRGARYTLPPRYRVVFNHAERPRGLPDGQQFKVQRGAPCPIALALATAYQQAGFIDDSALERDDGYGPNVFSPDACDLWDMAMPEDGAPVPMDYGFYEPLSHDEDVPLAYAMALAPAEIRSVMLELRQKGYAGIKAESVLLSGELRHRRGNLDGYFRIPTFKCWVTLDSCDSLGKPMMASTSVQLPSRYDPLEFWEEWQKELAEDDAQRAREG